MIELIRTAHPLEVDHKTIFKVKRQLEMENSTSEEKLKEIFSEIGIDLDLNELI